MTKCDKCKHHKAVEDQETEVIDGAVANAPVPALVFQAEMARQERTRREEREKDAKDKRRLWIALILVIVIAAASNLAWIIYENQFEDVEVTQENDGGTNNYIGNDGDINNYGDTDD